MAPPDDGTRRQHPHDGTRHRKTPARNSLAPIGGNGQLGTLHELLFGFGDTSESLAIPPWWNGRILFPPRSVGTPRRHQG